MPLTIEDLKPKPFKITVKGVDLMCQPLRLSHALIIAKIGDVFADPKLATKESIQSAEKDIDEIIAELIPELAGISLDMGSILAIITQLGSHNEPSDNAELNERGVNLNPDPKATPIIPETIG